MNRQVNLMKTDISEGISEKLNSRQLFEGRINCRESLSAITTINLISTQAAVIHSVALVKLVSSKLTLINTQIINTEQQSLRNLNVFNIKELRVISLRKFPHQSLLTMLWRLLCYSPWCFSPSHLTSVQTKSHHTCCIFSTRLHHGDSLHTASGVSTPARPDEY